MVALELTLIEINKSKGGGRERERERKCERERQIEWESFRQSFLKVNQVSYQSESFHCNTHEKEREHQTKTIRFIRAIFLPISSVKAQRFISCVLRGGWRLNHSAVIFITPALQTYLSSQFPKTDSTGLAPRATFEL